MKRYVQLIVIPLLVLVVTQEVAAGKRDKRPEKVKKEFVAKPMKYGFTAFLTGGYTTKDPKFHDVTGFQEVGDRLVYGGGVSFEVYPKQVYAVGFSFEYLFKQIPETQLKDVRAVVYSGTFAYFPRVLRRTMPYGRVSLGFASLTWPEYLGGDNMDMGTHMVFRLGIGLFTHTGSFTNTRFEVYYNLMSSDGLDLIKDYGPYLGVSIGVGIPF
ncbi:MAG: hypothetical protein JSV52_11025 [Candidatus Zixiibacteriota bacterium]|nr:MAG: hypothetical protein JSV52_11025 [candidate division Zixibacteria bacterium]